MQSAYRGSIFCALIRESKIWLNSNLGICFIMRPQFSHHHNFPNPKGVIKSMFDSILFCFRLHFEIKSKNTMYSARNLEMSIRFPLKFRPSERFHRPEMSQIKAEISIRTNVKLILHKNVGFSDFYNIRFEPT